MLYENTVYGTIEIRPMRTDGCAMCEPVDIQSRLGLHLEFTAKARECAARCVAYREQGNALEARTAELQALDWLRAAIEELELPPKVRPEMMR
jgi:hypothetical protein